MLTTAMTNGHPSTLKTPEGAELQQPPIKPRPKKEAFKKPLAKGHERGDQGKLDQLWQVEAGQEDVEKVIALVDKLPPQARLIYETVLVHGPITQSDLVTRLERTMTTQQDIRQVLMFYRGRLLDDGLLKINKFEKH